MRFRMVTHGFICAFLMLTSAAAYGDVKDAAGVLKSTVVIEWTPEKQVGKNEAQEAVDSSTKSAVPTSTETPPDATKTTPDPDPMSKIKITRTLPVPPAFPHPPLAFIPDLQLGAYTRYDSKSGNSIPSAVIGCGVIVDSKGLIVTSLEAGQNGQFSVLLEDGRKLAGTRLVLDQRSGLSLLKVDAQDLPAVQLCLDPLEIGESVLAGLSFDQRSRSISLGIVTGKNISANGPCGEVIQTNIKASDSAKGAPVVNMSGRLVGILTTSESPVEGMTFAVPARFVKMVLESRTEPKQLEIIRKAYLGVQFGGPGDDGAPNTVRKVFENTPAAQAGLREGDKILQIDDRPIQAAIDVSVAVGQHKRGDKITILYQRDGQEAKTEVELDEIPQSLQRPIGVNVVQPPHLLVLTTDGALEVMPPPTSVPPKVSRDPDQPQYTTPANKILKLWASEPKTAVPYEARNANKLLVERSDLNQKLDELKTQVDALKTEVTKLNKVLEQLEKKLTP